MISTDEVGQHQNRAVRTDAQRNVPRAVARSQNTARASASPGKRTSSGASGSSSTSAMTASGMVLGRSRKCIKPGRITAGGRVGTSSPLRVRVVPRHKHGCFGSLQRRRLRPENFLPCMCFSVSHVG